MWLEYERNLLAYTFITDITQHWRVEEYQLFLEDNFVSATLMRCAGRGMDLLRSNLRKDVICGAVVRCWSGGCCSPCVLCLREQWPGPAGSTAFQTARHARLRDLWPRERLYAVCVVFLTAIAVLAMEFVGPAQRVGAHRDQRSRSASELILGRDGVRCNSRPRAHSS